MFPWAVRRQPACAGAHHRSHDRAVAHLQRGKCAGGGAEGSDGGQLCRPPDGSLLHHNSADRDQRDQHESRCVRIDLGGAKILYQISDGGPVIEIIVGPGVNLSKLTLSNFGIQGNGSEGDGIKIVIDGADRTIADLSIYNISVEHVGGIGLDVPVMFLTVSSLIRG